MFELLQKIQFVCCINRLSVDGATVSEKVILSTSSTKNVLISPGVKVNVSGERWFNLAIVNLIVVANAGLKLNLISVLL